MNKWFLQRNFKYVFDTYEDLINGIYNKIINDEDFSLELVIDWYYDLDCSDENVFAELFEKMNLEFVNKHYDDNDEIIDILSTVTFEEKEKISIWYIENYFEDDGWQLIYGSPENKIINSKSDIEEILNKVIVNNKKMTEYAYDITNKIIELGQKVCFSYASKNKLIIAEVTEIAPEKRDIGYHQNIKITFTNYRGKKISIWAISDEQCYIIER